MGTVRSVAQARNRPRAALAWSLWLVLVFITVFLLSLRIAGATPSPTSPSGDTDDVEALADDLLIDERLVEDVLLDDLLAGDEDDLAHAHDLDAHPRARGTSLRRRVEVSLGYRRRTEVSSASRGAHEIWLTAGWSL